MEKALEAQLTREVPCRFCGQPILLVTRNNGHKVAVEVEEVVFRTEQKRHPDVDRREARFLDTLGNVYTTAQAPSGLPLYEMHRPHCKGQRRTHGRTRA